MSRIVKVQFEGTWVREALAEVLVEVSNEVQYWVPKSAATVIEDSSKDPVGTVRKDDDDGVWIKYADNGNRNAYWLRLDGGLIRESGDLAESRVVGAVPGTEAATRRSVEAETREEVTP